jgi:hypothetical protein
MFENSSDFQKTIEDCSDFCKKDFENSSDFPKKKSCLKIKSNTRVLACMEADRKKKLSKLIAFLLACWARLI